MVPRKREGGGGGGKRNVDKRGTGKDLYMTSVPAPAGKLLYSKGIVYSYYTVLRDDL